MIPIPCPDCQCGGRRLIYRTVRGARYVTRYRRCVDCGAVSKTIQRAGVADAVDVQELIDTISHQWNQLVTANETDAEQQLPRLHDAP